MRAPNTHRPPHHTGRRSRAQAPSDRAGSLPDPRARGKGATNPTDGFRPVHGNGPKPAPAGTSGCLPEAPTAAAPAYLWHRCRQVAWYQLCRSLFLVVSGGRWARRSGAGVQAWASARPRSGRRAPDARRACGDATTTNDDPGAGSAPGLNGRGSLHPRRRRTTTPPDAVSPVPCRGAGRIRVPRPPEGKFS